MTTTPVSDLPRTRAPGPPLVAEPGVRFAIDNAVIVLGLLVGSATGLGATASTALVILVAGSAGTGLALRLTAPLGLIGWAMVTGFAVHRYGDLTFAAGDLRRLVAMVIAVPLLAGVIGSVRVSHNKGVEASYRM